MVGADGPHVARRVPINSTLRTVLVDFATRRQLPDDSRQPVFSPRPAPGAFFAPTVDRGRAALAEAQDTSRLDGYVWHSNRHTFDLTAGRRGPADPQGTGGWKQLSMVQRYALSPAHLAAAVEKLVELSRFHPNEVQSEWPLRPWYANCAPQLSCRDGGTRQTRQTQNLVPARAWGFDSPSRHH